MRSILGPVLIAAGCAGAADGPADDTTDDGTDDTGGPARRDDTAIDWSRAPGQGDRGEDVSRTDAPIGPTALDGRWTGTFTLTEVIPFGIVNPVCAGTASLVVDGKAARHVIAELACPTWDPKNTLGAPYGPIVGVGFGTLDPAAPVPFRLDLGLGAKNKETVNAEGAVARLDGDLLTVRYDDVFGIGQLKAGHRVVMEVRREVP
ncbi:MAG: hypothetical protein H6732_19665 [Alphaproteobacteria bacterium]|nr:hypothetical protein [Alphaproteobacteria bacterium]